MKGYRNPATVALGRAVCTTLLDLIIEPMRVAARHMGYAITVHGSLARDIDLVAVPWVERAADPAALAETLRGAVAGICGACTLGSPGAKPHGRVAYILTAWADHSVFIDLSIMPTIAKPEGKEE